MKKAILCLWLAVCILPLSGCGSLRADTRELDKLLVIQTMGIDRENESIALSLASAADRSDGPVRLSARGESVSVAIDRIRARSYEEELFCAHVNHVIVGEAAAREGMEDILSYLCRSPDIRIDVPLYLVRGGEAKTLVLDTGDDSVGASEILDGIQSSLDGRDECRSFTAAEIARSLARYGSALICAVDCTPSAENDGEQTAEVCGYGVLRAGALCGYLTREEAVGAGFLLNKVGISQLPVSTPGRRTVTLELDRGSSAVEPVYDGDGELSGLDVFVTAGASVLETQGDPSGTDYLTAQLEAEVSRRVSAALLRSRELDADVFGLSRYLEAEDGEPARRPEELELRIHVRGELTHTNDLKGA